MFTTARFDIRNILLDKNYCSFVSLSINSLVKSAKMSVMPLGSDKPETKGRDKPPECCFKSRMRA